MRTYDPKSAKDRDLVERENARLKMLVARLAEWIGFPVGTIEASPDEPTMTLVIQLPSGVVHLPVEKKHAFGIWHQFDGDDDDPTEDVQELRINQVIAGVMVRTLRTYFVTKEDEESENGQES